jgi:hypothetical protein
MIVQSEQSRRCCKERQVAGSNEGRWNLLDHRA